MKKYKLKQTIVVPATGQSTAKIIKAGTIFYEQKHFYALEEKSMWAQITLDKADVESIPELFELVTEEKTE